MKIAALVFVAVVVGSLVFALLVGLVKLVVRGRGSRASGNAYRHQGGES